MNPHRRRRMIAFALALAAHMGIVLFVRVWKDLPFRLLAPEVALGGELVMEWRLDVDSPVGGEGAPAVPAPAPPPVEPPREVRAVVPAPPVRPPEPAPEPEVKPVVVPDPKPAPAAEPEPIAAVVEAKEQGPELKASSNVIEKTEGMAGRDARGGEPDAVTNGLSGAVALEPGKRKADSLSSGLPGGAAPLSTIHPRYPMGSRIRGEEGSVLLGTRVDVRGRPVEVAVLRSSGFFALDAAAEKAVKGARFAPPGSGAPPESYRAELTIRFQLKDP